MHAQGSYQNNASALPAVQELRAAAGVGATAGAVEWDTLKAVADAARQRKGAEAVPSLEQLCRGSCIVFPQRPKGPGKPPELQRRLDELRACLEQQQYDRMVSDVTQGERKAAALREGGLSTYRQQMSFGVHILAMMGAFYAFGHVAGMGITRNKAVHPFIGLLFMVSALVLETVLFIIRTTVPPKLHQEAARRAVAARVAQQQERQQPQKQTQPAEGGFGTVGSGGGSSKDTTAGGSGRKGTVAAEPQKTGAEKKGD